MPKVWCRDPVNQFGVFVPHEEQCHATYALGLHRKEVDESRDDVTRSATQMWARFRDGYEPDVEAGLGLGEPGDEADQPNQ